MPHYHKLFDQILHTSVVHIRPQGSPVVFLIKL